MDSAGYAIIGAIERANSIQNPFSGATTPWPSSGVPPWSTAAVSCWKGFSNSAELRKRNPEAMHIGDLRLKKMAASAVRA
jgi:hypothetical protein